MYIQKTVKSEHSHHFLLWKDSSTNTAAISSINTKRHVPRLRMEVTSGRRRPYTMRSETPKVPEHGINTSIGLKRSISRLSGQLELRGEASLG